MKNAIIGFFSIVIILLAGFGISTVEGKTMRQNELASTLSSAMKQSMEILTISKDYEIANEKEFAADFIQNAMIKMNSESQYKVEIFSIDTQKGLLDAKVTERYKKFLSPGKVSVRKIIVLDDYSNLNDEYYTVSFSENGEIFKQFEVYGGNMIPASMFNIGKSGAFECKELGVKFNTGENIPDIPVTKNLTFEFSPTV